MTQSRDHRRPATCALTAFAIASALCGCGRTQDATAKAASPGQEARMHGGDGCGRSMPRVVAETAPGRIALSGRLQTVTLKPLCGPLDVTVRAGDGAHRLLLVVEDLRADVQPGTVFDLRLASARGGGSGETIGALNFFAARRPGHNPALTISFDVTRALHAAAQAGAIDGLAITIVPTARVGPGSDASIGAIRLIEQ